MRIGMDRVTPLVSVLVAVRTLEAGHSASLIFRQALFAIV